MRKKIAKKKNLKGTIISALREIHRNYDENRKLCKERSKVAPATYQCEICGIWIYEGKSVKNFEKMKEEYPSKEMIMKNRYKIQIDHIDPIIKLEHWEWNWHEYIERLFCDIDNLQAICSACHSPKTKKETQIRKNLRNSVK